ncbi:hypothetical protein J3R30DRAFT_1756881 [Lentinula aciculospora]|uniref:Uncharacterized protein n=1 Tax=Lentinula aciculospora TaxID=153920 RepID=A0A9W9DRS5_9AGAR|nr:hypothetical protein J3R30DRAFT_1756881 [Lentinula aciculospora]
MPLQTPTTGNGVPRLLISLPESGKFRSKLWVFKTIFERALFILSQVKAVDLLKNIPTMIHLVDCIWEFFIIIGSEARAQRQSIRIALHVASELVKRVAWQRPYTPPVHVVVLPSQMPLDLRIHLREIDESSMNPQGVPEHMNLLTDTEAHDHLRRTLWERFSLRDPLMLPLGIHPRLLG